MGSFADRLFIARKSELFHAFGLPQSAIIARTSTRASTRIGVDRVQGV
jgi:hypothetical protein